MTNTACKYVSLTNAESIGLKYNSRHGQTVNSAVVSFYLHPVVI